MLLTALMFGCGLALFFLGAGFWVAHRDIPQDIRDIEHLSYKEAVKALGYEGVRLKRLGDWGARAQLMLFGQAKATRLYRPLMKIGLSLILIASALEVYRKYVQPG